MDRRYELCNQYGLYVMDEANVETHGFDPLQNNNEVRNAAQPLAVRCSYCDGAQASSGLMSAEKSTHARYSNDVGRPRKATVAANWLWPFSSLLPSLAHGRAAIPASGVPVSRWCRPTRRRGQQPSWTEAPAWWGGTATTPASSSGPWATRAAMGPPTLPWQARRPGHAAGLSPLGTETLLLFACACSTRCAT